MEKISGIYKITNTVNEKFYIGSSKDIYRRWYHHKNSLNKGNHNNYHIQKAWNKYGSESFEFSILEKCEENILDKEQEYLNKYWDDEKIYNISKSASAPMLGRRHSDETRRYFSESRKGKLSGEKNPMYGKKLSIEQRQHLSKMFSGENNPMYGTHLSEYSKKKLSEANKGHKCPEYQKQKQRLSMLGSGNPFYGEKHTKESLELMSKNRTGLLKGDDSPVSRKVVRISDKTNEIKIYDTVTQAAEENGAQRSHIALVCRGKRKHAGGYKWLYFEDYQQANTEVINQIAKG